MKKSSFTAAKQDLEEACAFLRCFTLARNGYTQQDGVAGIRRVTACCDLIEELFGTGPDANESAALVAAARPRVWAAQARLNLLRATS